MVEDWKCQILFWLNLVFALNVSLMSVKLISHAKNFSLNFSNNKKKMIVDANFKLGEFDIKIRWLIEFFFLAWKRRSRLLTEASTCAWRRGGVRFKAMPFRLFVDLYSTWTGKITKKLTREEVIWKSQCSKLTLEYQEQECVSPYWNIDWFKWYFFLVEISPNTS